MSISLTNRIAVIIGATGQLGPAVAHAFADAGARLVLVGTPQTALDTLRIKLGYRESRVITLAADPLSETDINAAAERVREKFERADILLHLVGHFRGGTLAETSDALWDEMLNVNLRSAIFSLRAFLPLLTANEWGRIVTISSGTTQSPPPNAAAYVSAKAALEAMTLSVAQEAKDKGVTANVVLVRALDTNATREKSAPKKSGVVRPEDVAATLLFLCSEEGGAITGARIPVFGGS